jgi:hypothetical protein
MDESGPVAVEGTGTPPSKEPNSYNCHPDFKITYTYANGTKLICSSHQVEGSADPKKGPNGKSHDNGVLFLGEDGKWIFVSRETIEASDEKLISEPLPPDAKKLYLSTNHMGNFIDGVRSRKPCICPAEIGHHSVTVCHIGVIALRTGKKLKWDPEKMRFDDEEANKMLSREMRKPWTLES